MKVRHIFKMFQRLKCVECSAFEATNISPVREEKDIEWVLKLQLVLTATWHRTWHRNVAQERGTPCFIYLKKYLEIILTKIY